MTAAAITHREKIISDLQEGKYLKHIAAELHVTPGALCHFLADDPEYRKARETGVNVKLDSALEGIESAGDDLNLARAREVACRRLEWRAEREFPERWGGAREAQLPQIVINLVSYTQQPDGVAIEHNAPFPLIPSKLPRKP